MFLELELANNIILSNDINVFSPKTISLPLLTSIVSVLSVVSIATRVMTGVTTRKIVGFHVNDMLHPPMWMRVHSLWSMFQ